MRILLIGHTYVTKENQKKLHALARLPNIELTTVTPPLWREILLKETVAHHPTATRFTFTTLPIWFSQAEQFYLYRSFELGLKEFQPDIVYVEQGAGAFVYTQSLIARNLFAPKAKAVFFTWWNLPYRASLPLRLVEKFNLAQSQGAVAGNQEAANILRAHGCTAPISVLPQLGVDPLEFAPQPQPQLRAQLGLTKLTIGYVGRLVEEKGIRVLLEALAKLEVDFQLLIVGRGSLEAEIKKFAFDHNWGGKLKMIAGIDQTEIAKYINCMDLIVVPSLTRPFWKEQFGHVIIGAMACGVPVIGSNSAEVPRVIGDAGVVAPEGNVEALYQAIKRLAASPELRQQLGEAGRQRILGNFTHEKIAQQLIQFFETL